MKKRRRAYKKYDWRKHQFQCIIMSAVRKTLAEEIDKAILYGAKEMPSPSVRIAVPDYLLKKVSK